MSDVSREDVLYLELTMVSVEHVAHKVLAYIPYVLVLIDMRYEGKKLTNFTKTTITVHVVSQTLTPGKRDAS